MECGNAATTIRHRYSAEMGNLFRSACQNRLKSLAKFFRVPIDSWHSPLKISVKSKKRVITSADVQFSSPNQVKSKKDYHVRVQLSSPQKLKGHMARVPEKRARVPNSARVPGVAHPWYSVSKCGRFSRGWYILKKIKSSLYSGYYAKVRNERWDPFPRLSAWAIQLRRNVAAVARRWRHCADLTELAIEPPTSRSNSACLGTELTGQLLVNTKR